MKDSENTPRGGKFLKLKDVGMGSLRVGGILKRTSKDEISSWGIKPVKASYFLRNAVNDISKQYTLKNEGYKTSNKNSRKA